MSDVLIVDASVAVKWCVEEEEADIAEIVLRSAKEIRAPRLLFGEVANAIWKKVWRGDLLPRTGMEAISLLPGCIHTVVDKDELLFTALEIAVTYNHPVYDCVYIACAREFDLPLVTADARLLRKFRSSPYGPSILLLSDWRA
ncbi:type II toxin-antitoxin system VapC family toxin [Xanthobacter sp. V4C-4]|uniref:type II toxin-antitoxin system VapC family toxin n=1 Tax=Xanthobacter cornucopiae TaxID=3119924 RepID=UPI00372C0FB5